MCEELEPGDIVIFLQNSDNPDTVAFFPLTSIPAEVGSLFLTDNAWTGTELLDEEGTLEVCGTASINFEEPTNNRSSF